MTGLPYPVQPDVEAVHASVVAAGHDTGELHVTFYGMKEFEMLDPDGHVLVFGQATDEPPSPRKEGS